MSENITLIVKKLEFKAIIGLLENERKNRQKVIVFAQILVNYEKNNFVDYATICKKIKSSIKKGKFFTVEDALIKTTDNIFNINVNIKEVKLKIFKPNILSNVVVGAQFYRKN